MEIKITQNNNSVVVAVAGRLDTLTSSELEQALSPYFTANKLHLIMECGDMEYISSAGLRIILMAHKSITANGGCFILRNINKEVRSVFDITGLSRILTIE